MDEMKRLLHLVNDLAVDKVSEAIFTAWKGDRRVFICGNGGSALTSSHWALDLMKTAEVDGQPRLKAISLTDNVGVITAVGNDVSFDDVFRYPLDAYAEQGDILIAISCSGNSPNVISACEWAATHGLTVIALTGFTGGKLRELGDIRVHVPSDNYGIIEDMHMAMGHMAAQGLRARILAQEEVATWTS